MTKLTSLLNKNQNWASQKAQENPDFFPGLAAGQSPSVLYIGCSDSRVVIETFTESAPGTFFTHRNIAAIVNPEDPELLAVLEYGLLALKIPNIVVATHEACGGIQGAIAGEAPPHTKEAIQSVRDLYRHHQEEIDAKPTLLEKANSLAPISAIAQIEKLLSIPFIRDLYNEPEAENAPQLHAWVVPLETGKIKTPELPITEWKSKGLLPNHYPNP